MEKPVTEMLSVPGARLYTETRGSGPPLVFLVGGNGDAEVFGQIAAALAGQFTIVTYDRRGFARSPLDGPVDDAARIAADVDDAVAVIEHTARGPAHVFGSSSGAIVALGLLARHPSRVGTLVAHEPPLVTLLPDGAHWLAAFDDVYATYAASGVAPAMAKFSAAIGLEIGRPRPGAPPPDAQPHPGAQPQPGALPPQMVAMGARIAKNQEFWLQHELRSYPRFTPDIDALRAVAGQLVLGVGRDSRGTMLERPARALAETLQVPAVEFAGGHVGYLTDPAEFAPRLREVLGRGPR